LLFISSRAYIIDDADATVTYAYNSSQGSMPWARLSLTSPTYLTGSNGSVIFLDYTRIHSQTLTFANCNATLDCQIMMPFTGSGITIYGVLFPGFSNFTVSIDGTQAPAPTPQSPVVAESPPLYNIALYEYHGLPVDVHELVITIVSWQLQGAEIALDYVDVNEAPTTPGATTTTPAPAIPTYSGSTFSAYPSPLSAAGRSKGVVIGAAVGGTVGGLIVIASIAALVVLYLRRKKQTRSPPVREIDNNEPKHFSYTSSPLPPHSPEPYMTYSPYSTYTTTTPTPNLPQL